MAPISLQDTIRLEEGEEGIDFQCSDPDLPTGVDNLAVRAAETFYGELGLLPQVSIRLEKRIPAGAGLGGGSSDAAAVLRALGEKHRGAVSAARLVELAATLGSDVPFFLAQSAAWCRGRGEIVQPTTLPTALPLLLLKPSFGVPTPWAYSRWPEARELPGVPLERQSFAGLLFFNDLERPVFEKYPFLALTKSWLLQQPEVGAALMSGSGSTVFAVLKDRALGEGLADRAQAELDPELWTCGCETVLS